MKKKRPRHDDRMMPSSTKRGPGRKHVGGTPRERSGEHFDIKAERRDLYLNSSPARNRAKAQQKQQCLAAAMRSV